MSQGRRKVINLRPAWAPVVETLEERRFLASSTIQPLPFVLDFNTTPADSLADKDGSLTGFTRVQENENGNGYQPALIDLITASGVLKLTTTGTSTAGSNYNGDNTLVNALETQFDATTNGFKISTRIVGPLSYLSKPSHQGGISFGPDQDNYVKLVAVVNPQGSFIQFVDEQTTGTTYSHTLDQKQSVGSFASINTLDLQMVGNASTGTVEAFYAINGGAFVKVPGTVTIASAKRASFFNSAGRAGIVAAAKNDLPPIQVTFDRFAIESGAVTAQQPMVTATRPAHGQTNVPRDTFIAADVFLPTAGASIDPTTLNSNSVTLYRSSDHSPVAAVLNTSGGGDAIVLTPIELLDENTSYTFEVNSNLLDGSGAPFQPYTATFTTGTAGGTIDASMAFEKIPQLNAQGNIYTCVVMSPDNTKLFAATIDGRIQRFDLDAQGNLGAPFEITSLQAKEGGPTLLIGMAFDAQGNLWVSHSEFTDVESTTAQDFTGKISKLSGANFSTAQTMIVNLPRSVKDHMTNQLTFGPDGALYFAQGSNTAMGAPDNAWGLRSEHMLNAAVLRVDITKLGASPLDAKTTDAGGTYNPFAAGAALTLYATGIRNAYDLTWHKGKLYVATNGSAAGGSTPGTPAGSWSFGANQRIDFGTNGAYNSINGPAVPALSNVQQTQNDYIFHVVQGGYYGHPNPVRGEFVMNGGNPTAGVDPNEVPAYPVGTMPDRNYRGNFTGTDSLTKGTAYVYGKNYSPDGIIAYRNANSFSGLLKDKLLVAEYSGGDAIGVLTVDANTNITKRQTGIAGLTHFVDPLDLIENPNTGFLYVAEYGGQQLILVRPITPGANLTTDKSKMVFNDTTATGASPQQKITITNTGTTALAFPTDGLSITGTSASQFAFVNKPNPIPSIAPGDSLDIYITFTANSVGDIKTANLQLKSNDEDQMTINVPLRGLGTSGTGGANEPSLQKIMDLYQIPITVGDNNPADVTFPEPPITPNNELVMPVLMKDGPGEVTIEPLAVFGVGNASIPTFRFGYYKPGNRQDTTELFKSVGTGESQTVDPHMIGVTTFDPGENPFGIYTWWQNFQNQPTVFSEDALNKSYDATEPRKVRFYPLKTAQGAVVPNAYIFAFEEFNNSTDMQDFVGIIRNVKAAPAGAEIGIENLDGLPFSDRLVFNKIENANNSADGKPNNIYHDLSTLRIRNTGSQALTIHSLVISSGWQIEGVPATPFNIAAGGQQDVKVRFVANPGGSQKVLQGTLTINSSDTDEPTTQIQLGAHWQPRNERGNEPPLASVVQAFGWTTNIPTGSGLNQGGRITRVAEEVLSPYWKRADQTLPVSVRQLAAYHTQGSSHNVQYHTKGSNTTTTIFTHDGDEGQSFLPHKEVAAVGTVSPDFAAGVFNHTGTFGFKVESEWSDPTKNVQEQPGGGYGHHVRFFVVRDRDGKIVPNTYIMTMDFSGINYDYQDNIYLISNVVPESAPSTPTGLTAVASGAGIDLNWNDNTEPNLAGYNVYRSSSSGGTYTKINSALITSSDFNDVAAPIGTSYYKVAAVDTSGNASVLSAFVSGNRTNDTTPPPVPSGLTAVASANSIQLNWNNSSAADIKGYNVYRSTTAGGPWGSPINVQLLNNSDFTDTSAPIGVVSYYYVTAVDQANNESGGATANAMRPSSDVTPPAKPTIDSTTPTTGGIAIDWADNQDVDLAGYNVYRSPDGVNNWQKLNVSLLLASFFNDTGAPTGVTSFYRVTAVDTSNNESQPATTSAVRPADTEAPATPTGLGFDPKVSGIVIAWDANSELDLAGYNVLRSDAPNGTFTQINGQLLTSPTFTDTTAPADVVSYYRVVAVDASNNISDPPATGSTTRPAPDLTPPAIPQGLGALLNGSAIALNWDDNLDSDLAGYNVYRSATSVGGFTKINASLVATSAYNDATAPIGTSYYYVTAVDTSGNESDPSGNANATRSLAYSFAQIGSPTPAGSLTPVGDNGFDLVAGGADIYNTSDSFGFAYQQVTGDFDFKVRVAGLTNTNAFAKAGLMARETLAANSRNVFVMGTPGSNGHRFTYRTTSGGTTSTTGSGAVSYPNNWLRLERVGNTFRGYRSTNGVDWTLVGQTTNNAMPQSIFLGLAVTSHNTAAAATGQFRDVPTATTPDPKPATPTGLVVVGSETGVDLNWADNNDSDLAGYNVYRSNSANGTFTKVNTSLLTSSAFFDATAPGGQSFYRVYAVDTLGQESATPATGAGTRTDLTPPAQPTGLTLTPSTSGIQLNWTANGEADLAGYDVYRSANGVDGWQKLNTNRLTSAAYLDTTAPENVKSFYRVIAVDTSNNPSTPATGSATRPANVNIKINFQLNGSATVAGYNQDNGDIFGDRGNGLTYGFNTSHTAEDRDRNKNANQLLDTLVQMKANSTWSINLANGTYQVKLSVGDSQYSSSNTVTINGVNYWTNQALGINQFAQKTMTVTVTNGKLVLSNAGGADRMTKLNFIEITSA